MSASRPTTSPQLVATIIESAPDRVRRRLDRSPNAASEWDWKEADNSWAVDTGGETVSIAAEHLESIDQITCSCLLSPRCFHVLACLSSLQVANTNGASTDEDTPTVSTGTSQESPDLAASSSSADATVQISEGQQNAVSEFSAAIHQLLRVGVANCGLIIQSSLLRAVHQCRAESLHRASAIGLRIIAGTNQFRARSPDSDPLQLAEDVATALEIIASLQQNHIPEFWIGTARRKQYPIRPRKLHGLLAEPIVTRSGFAGAAAYFLGEDDCIYSASDVKPGDAQLARDAYLGGIEIGPLVQPAKRLARHLYVGSQMTASPDGRLGRGKSIKLAEQGTSTWSVEPIQKRFSISLSDQLHQVYQHAALPEDIRPAGWDFVFAIGTVIGAAGPEILLQHDDEETPLRLGIANENDALLFRDNLQMLCHASGLRLQVVGRMDLEDPAVVYPLAIADATNEAKGSPQLELPDALDGRLFVGLDELQRSHIRNAESQPRALPAFATTIDTNLLNSLRRRWLASLIGGSMAQRNAATTTTRSEIRQLQQSGFSTAAALLNATVQSNSEHSEVFLATYIYLRACRFQLAQSFNGIR